MENEINTFDEGVAPGGLRNSTQIKVLIVFLIGTVREPTGIPLLTEALQVHRIANYFDIAGAIDDLIENGTLSEKDGLLNLTQKGKVSFRELSDDLPHTIKETALSDVIGMMIIEKNGRENSVEIINTENGYNVVCKVAYAGTEFMNLSLYAADMEQAEMLKHNFLKNPSKIYSAVVSALYS